MQSNMWAAPGCDFEEKYGAKILVQCEKPFYEPGEQVNGKVYICVRSNAGGIYVDDLELKIKGEEKAEFIHWEWEGDDDNRRRVAHHKHGKHTHVKGEQKVYQPPQGWMANGNYDFSFYMFLPHNIPSTVHFKDKHHEQKPEMKIKYYIKAHLDIKGMKDVKYKHTLIVREKMEQALANVGEVDRDPIITCCCLN